MKSYKNHGFGLWLVELKDSNIPTGMCGLVNRDSLENVDIGFAILPQYTQLGYGLEAAKATMRYAKYALQLHKIVAITDSKNITSINLLNKLGFCFDKTIHLSENDTVLLFSPKNDAAERKKLLN